MENFSDRLLSQIRAVSCSGYSSGQLVVCRVWV